ncbi:MAG: hypothetical protein D6799_07450, partial [Bacteroidetes bacterium]
MSGKDKEAFGFQLNLSVNLFKKIMTELENLIQSIKKISLENLSDKELDTLKDEIIKKPNLWTFYTWCLLKASHKEKEISING